MHQRALQETWMADTKATADLAFDAFVESYALKYERAADCLSKDRDALLAFYDSRPSIGNTCGRPIPSKAPSPPCATGGGDNALEAFRLCT
jgi:hypothetical protein